MTHGEREAGLLVKLARVRARIEDLCEELNEAGLERTAYQVREARSRLDNAKQTLMSAIRKVEDR